MRERNPFKYDTADYVCFELARKENRTMVKHKKTADMTRAGKKAIILKSKSEK
jgi:hypothetical protein